MCFETLNVTVTDALQPTRFGDTEAMACDIIITGIQS